MQKEEQEGKADNQGEKEKKGKEKKKTWDVKEGKSVMEAMRRFKFDGCGSGVFQDFKKIIVQKSTFQSRSVFVINLQW